MTDMRQKLSLEHRLSLNQLQIQSLEILALSNEEIWELLEQEYQENPMLDYAGNSRARYEEPLHFAREIPARHEDIRKEVLMQLNRMDYSEEEWRVMEYLTWCLDEQGYCREKPADVAAVLKVDALIVGKCLEELRGLEPAGIFSSSLKQCLIYQLRAQGMNDPVLEEIIETYLEALCEGKISTITRAVHISTAQVGKYLRQIQRLNPIPLAGYGNEAEYIRPDIICRKSKGQWEVKLADNWSENYYLNDYYLKLYMGSTDEELKGYFKQKLERARFVLNSIESRRNTILRIVREIVNRQAVFFEQNEEPVPMRMEDIADALGIHVSTVSRAIKNKYAEYPGGTVLIKDLFGLTVGASEDEKGATAKEIKRAIQDIIAEEDWKNPVSDQRICAILQEMGMVLSRRCVAKYRQEMGILSGKRRKELYSIRKIED